MTVPQKAITAASMAIRANRDQPATGLARIALQAAAPHMGRPVYVLAIGHDLTAQDAENIQRVVAEVLRHPPEPQP